MLRSFSCHCKPYCGVSNCLRYGGGTSHGFGCIPNHSMRSRGICKHSGYGHGPSLPHARRAGTAIAVQASRELDAPAPGKQSATSFADAFVAFMHAVLAGIPAAFASAGFMLPTWAQPLALDKVERALARIHASRSTEPRTCAMRGVPCRCTNAATGRTRRACGPQPACMQQSPASLFACMASDLSPQPRPDTQRTVSYTSAYRSPCI
jgi:hypothetical protein